jgi:hypothetical protein
MLLKAMQQGGDVMALFQQHGMTVQDWTASAQAWAMVMQTRHDVGMRFAKLLQ